MESPAKNSELSESERERAHSESALAPVQDVPQLNGGGDLWLPSPPSLYLLSEIALIFSFEIKAKKGSLLYEFVLFHPVTHSGSPKLIPWPIPIS